MSILSGLKYKLVCHFELAANMVGGGMREFDGHGWTIIPEMKAGDILYG
jgi:hypothetical protein